MKYSVLNICEIRKREQILDNKIDILNPPPYTQILRPPMSPCVSVLSPTVTSHTTKIISYSENPPSATPPPTVCGTPASNHRIL